MSDEVKIYQDAGMPLYPFIQATVTHDLTVLIISGKPDEITPELQERLEQAWLAINGEFTELIGDPETKTYSESLLRISQLSARLLRLRMVVESLRITYDERLIEILKAEDFGLDFERADVNGFEDDLERVLTKLIADEIELEELIAVQNKKSKPDEVKTPVTEAQFEEVLLEISHKEGLHYDVDRITVRKYAQLIKRLKRHQPKPQTV